MPRPADEFSYDALVELEPREERYPKRFRGGIEVRVYPLRENKKLPTKTITYVYDSPITESRRRMTIGDFDSRGVSGLSFKQALSEIREAQAIVRSGDDPQERAEREKKALTTELRERAFAKTVNSLAEDFLRLKQVEIEAATIKFYEGRLRLHALPILGDFVAREVTKADVHNVVSSVQREVTVSESGKVLSAISALFGWAENQGMVETNPARGINKPKAVKRKRVLSESELWLLLKVLSRTRIGESLAKHLMSDSMMDCLLLLLATGQRPGEICEAEWREIDLVAKVWTLPATKTKNHHPHAVPLNNFAMDILKKRLESKGSKYVFPSRMTKYGGEKPMSNESPPQAVKRWHDKGEWDFEQPRWRPHDLRRTMRTNLSRLKVKRHVAERVINHLPAGVEGVYDQYEYLEEKREALDHWGSYLVKLAQRGAPPSLKRGAGSIPKRTRSEIRKDGLARARARSG